MFESPRGHHHEWRRFAGEKAEAIGCSWRAKDILCPRSTTTERYDLGGEGHPRGLEAGYFVKPTVFVNVKNEMAIAQEEIFGPVLSVITYDTEDEAIRIANDSKYGLHAAVIGTNVQRARRVASQLRAGRVVINGMTDDPQAPWGGFKYSGIGREYGRYGIEAFLETRALLEA